MTQTNSLRILLYILGAIHAIGILEMPNAYYDYLLYPATFTIGLYAAFCHFKQSDKELLPVLFIFIAVFWNPFFHEFAANIPKIIWMPINATMALYLFGLGWFTKRDSD
ncbi:hypothetical protein SPONN_1266 [uncultured Candidatus Thioglobus sp.]|nr:hypothetical protein SPONN_1266 [uncultured Candidatus Thioglobus sp.]